MKKFRISRYLCLLIAFALLLGCIYKPKDLKTDPQQKYRQVLEKRQQWLEHIKTYWYRYFEKKVETKHFVFYLIEDKPWEIIETEIQEQFYEYLAELFGVESEKKIIYIKCRDTKDVEKITNNSDVRAQAFLDLNLIISVEYWENHELVHIFQNLVTKCPHFFIEGLAVAYQVYLNENNEPYHMKGSHVEPYIRWPSARMKSVNWYLQKIIEHERYIEIDKILASKEFVDEDKKDKLGITYVETGSFVRYLIDVYGLEKFFQLLKLSDYLDSKELIEKKFLKVYSISIQKMEKQWLNFLKENY